jgi:hypothetical protein
VLHIGDYTLIIDKSGRIVTTDKNVEELDSQQHNNQLLL